MDSSSFPFNPLDWPGCLELPRKYRGLAWKEHIPFAMSLVQMVKPRVLVELGVHMGDSYLAFCQAIAELKLETKAYGVDTWQGDPHAGFYGETIYEELQAYHGPNYSTFSQLIRNSFDEAVKEFGDRSIDLLHIDGFHTYEAVKHDWETWRPKVSSRGIVLFHDINVHERNFGVWQLWGELKASYPHFDFSHGHGLGVLAYGSEIPAGLSRLLALKEDERALVRRFYSRVGHYLTLQTELNARIATVETAEVIRQLHVTHQEAIAKLSSEHGATINALSAEQRAANAAHQETIAKLTSEHGTAVKTVSAELRAQRAEFDLKSAEHEIHTAELHTKLVEQSARLERIYARERWMDRCDALRSRGQHILSRSLRVLFVSDRIDKPHLYRVQHSVEQVQAEGGYARHVSLAHCRAEWLERFNAVVFVRQPYNTRVQELLDAAKRSNAATVFDCDELDCFKSAEFPEPEPAAQEHTTQDLERTCRACEWFIGCTPALVDRLAQMGLPGLLHRDTLSNAQVRLGDLLYPLRKLRASEPLLGYFSDTNTCNEDFRSIEDSLERVFESHKNAKLIFVSPQQCDRLPRRFPGRILQVPYELRWNEYPAIMARCHAVLMPMAQTTPFADCRSALKFLQAGIVGVPAIASPSDEFRRMIVDGQNGWLATTSADWAGCLSAALDTALSKKVGQAARDTALNAQSIQAAKGSLSALLRGIVRNDTQPLTDAPEIALSSAPRETLRQKLKYIKRLSIFLYSDPKRWATSLG